MGRKIVNLAERHQLRWREKQSEGNPPSTLAPPSAAHGSGGPDVFDNSEGGRGPQKRARTTSSGSGATADLGDHEQRLWGDFQGVKKADAS